MSIFAGLAGGISSISGALGSGGSGSSIPASSGVGSDTIRTDKQFTFGAPVVNKVDYTKIALIIGGAVVVYAIIKRRK